MKLKAIPKLGGFGKAAGKVLNSPINSYLRRMAGDLLHKAIKQKSKGVYSEHYISPEFL